MAIYSNALAPQKKIDAAGINRIFIGGLFIFLSFRFNGFDVIPDFVGYIFILSGLNALEEYSPLFKKAKILAAISFLLSFSSIYQVTYPLGETPRWLYFYTPTVGLATMLLHIALHYYIIYGIIALAESAGKENIQYNGRITFKVYCASRVIGFAVNIFALFLGAMQPVTSALIIAAVAIAFIVNICYLVFLRMSYNRLNNAEHIDVKIKDDEHKTKKIATAALSGLLLLVLMFSGGYAYYSHMEKTYLFTPLNFPTVLSREFQREPTNFKKPADIVCIVLDDEGAARFISDRSTINETTKYLINKLCDILERSSPSYINDNPHFGSLGGFFGDEFYIEQEDELTDTKNYNLYFTFDKGEYLRLKLNDKNSDITVNDRKYTLRDEDWRDLLNYIEKTFVIDMDR